MDYFIFILIQVIIMLLKNDFKSMELKFKLMLFLAFLFSVLRFDVSQDYQSYYKIGMGYQLWDYKRFEFSSKIFYQIVWYLKMPQVYFLLVGVVSYYFLYKGIKNNSKNKLFSIYIFICFFFISSFSIVRQSIAELYLIFIFDVLMRNIWIYIFLIFLGSSFHKTILVALLFVPLSRIKLSKVILLILNFSIFYKTLIIKLLDKIPIDIFKKIIIEIRKYENNLLAGGTKWIYLYILINLFLILNKSKIKNSRKEEICLNIVVAGTFFYGIIGGLSGFRIAEYFLIIYIILIPSYYERLSKSKKYLVIIFMIFIFLLQIFLGRQNLIPYKFIFLQDKKIIFRDNLEEEFEMNIKEIEKLRWRIR